MRMYKKRKCIVLVTGFLNKRILLCSNLDYVGNLKNNIVLYSKIIDVWLKTQQLRHTFKKKKEVVLKYKLKLIHHKIIKITCHTICNKN